MDANILITILVIFGAEIIYTNAVKKKAYMCKYSNCCNVTGCVDELYGNIIGCKTEKYIHVNSAYQEKIGHCPLCGHCCVSNKPNSNEHTNRIAELCNGNQTCTITDTGYWMIEITYDCVEAVISPKILPVLPSSTRHKTRSSPPEITAQSGSSRTTSIPTAAFITQAKKANKSNSSEAESKTYPPSEKFHVTTVTVAITASILILGIVLVGIVCFKRRKANNDEQENNRISSKVVTQNVANRAYDATSPPDNTTEPRENSGPDYEYAAVFVATKTTNENEYNTLNKTSQPIKSNPNYDHIPKQSTSVNKFLAIPNEDVYNTLNENANCLNDDANYDHVSKPSPTIDETYSHIKSGISI